MAPGALPAQASVERCSETVAPSAAASAMSERNRIPSNRTRPDALVRDLSRARDRGAQSGDGENPPPVRHEPLSLPRGAGVKHERATRLGLLDARDLAATVAVGRIVARCEHDGRRGGRAERHGGTGEIAAGGGGEDREQVRFEQRENGLRLRIAEAGVELEHPGTVRRQHEPRVEEPDERGSTAREFGEHRPMHLLDERSCLGGTDAGHGRVGTHPAGVRPVVAVERALEVLGRR